MLFHLLTCILVAAKLFAVAPITTMSWWVVLAPSLIALAFWLVVVAAMLFAAFFAVKR